MRVLIFYAVMICSALMGSCPVFAQAPGCPPNIDFEFGDLSLWECRIGFVQAPTPASLPYSAIITNTITPPIPNRHTITSGPGVDPYGLFPVVAPGGGTKSLRLGNDSVYFEAERVVYKLKIPVNMDSFAIRFKYAVVFEGPHLSNQNPRFELNAYDSATGLEIPCVAQFYIGGPGIPGFFASPDSMGVWYKPWSDGILNIKNKGGQTVYLHVVTGDCTLGAHFGYGYFDVVSCGGYKITVDSCDLNNAGFTFSGPPGYVAYDWYDQFFTNLIGTGQSISILPTSTTPQYYNLVLTYNSQTSICKDTLKTIMIADINLAASPDTSCISPNEPLQLSANAIGGMGGLQYSWTSTVPVGSTLSCTTCPNPIAVSNGSGFYTVKVTDTNGCYRRDTVSVFYTVFKPDAGPDTTTCQGTPVTLNGSVMPAGNLYTYRWTPSSGLSSNSILNPSFSTAQSGTFTFVLTVDSSFCSKNDSVTIDVLSTDLSGGDTAICKGAIIQPNLIGDPRYTYSWSPSKGLSNPNIMNPIIAADTTTTYVVTASHPACSTLVNYFQITVEPLPSVDLGPDRQMCQWEEVIVQSNVLPSWYSKYIYQWTSASTGDSILARSPNHIYQGHHSTDLKLVVNTPAGCIDSDEVHITVHPGNFAVITPDTALCPNNSVILSVSGGKSYRWSPPLFLSDSTSSTVVSTPPADMSYTVFVIDQFGCKDTVHTSIDILADGVLELGPDITMYLGDTVQMNPATNCHYFLWTPPTGLSATTISNPRAFPQVNTKYIVTARTENGCVAIDSINVIVLSESALDLPNAFTPGNSGSNNRLKVIRRGQATLNYFKIFNRWGNLIFQSSDIDEGWDGKYNGIPQPMGVYVYLVEAVTPSGRKFTKSGNVMLIR
jgi:gliding motility-associated-like protein